ncbi:MAG TPA: hypothetical protein VI432_00710 [Candidatus Paceibacterota bacterium]
MYKSNGNGDFKEKHGYIVEGRWYPRVTSILDIKAKPALYRFYGGLESFARGEMIKQKSADEGTLLHQAAERVLTGQYDGGVDPRIEPSVITLIDFIKNTNIQVDADWVEKRVINFRDRYAGTIDALAVIDGKFGVLDIKTSQSIYRDYNLQTAAYFSPLSETFDGLQTRWILRVDQNQKCLRCGAKRRIKGGHEKIRKNGFNGDCLHDWSEMRGEIELKEFPHWYEDFEAFLAAKRLWEWENENSLKKIGYLL